MKMLNKKLFLMCGPAGSGKSTWARNRVAQDTDRRIHISRDVFRFALLQEGDDYFAHENEAFANFIAAAREAIGNPQIEEIYIDATHLKEMARNKVLDELDLSGCDVIPVVVKPALETTLDRNEERKGHAYVPRSVIRRMDASFEKPTFEEEHQYAEIWEIIDNGILVIPRGGNK